MPCLTKPYSGRATVQVLARSPLVNPETVADPVPQLRTHAQRLVRDAHAADRLLKMTLR